MELNFDELRKYFAGLLWDSYGKWVFAGYGWIAENWTSIRWGVNCFLLKKAGIEIDEEG